jgi:hypothetical protein
MLPVYVLLAALVTFFILQDGRWRATTDYDAVLALGGFGCAEIGKRLPIRNLDAAAILRPSCRPPVCAPLRKGW